MDARPPAAHQKRPTAETGPYTAVEEAGLAMVAAVFEDWMFFFYFKQYAVSDSFNAVINNTVANFNISFEYVSMLCQIG